MEFNRGHLKDRLITSGLTSAFRGRRAGRCRGRRNQQLKEDLAHMGWLAVGRKYGAGDNAVRKWIRWYEQDAEAA